MVLNTVMKKRSMGQRVYDQIKMAKRNESGFTLLLVVVIIGMIAVSVTVPLLLFGVTQSMSSLTQEQSAQARGLANACAEEALQQIRDSTPFSGSGSLSLSTGDCDYVVTNTGGKNREIEATGTVDTIERKVFIQLDQINPSINITSWQEVADF